MKYRQYGKKLDFQASVFGYGCMRMPQIKDEQGNMVPDQPFANQMIHAAIKGGVNYFDTANTYMGGLCDAMLGEALDVGGYRKQVMVVSKIQPSLVSNEADFTRILDAQLVKLKSDYLDVLLTHSLNEKSYAHALEVGMFDMMDRAIAQGKIRAKGFSFHDNVTLFKKIVDSHDFVMCNVQMNVLDHDYQATVDGINYAHDKGLAVCAMEPLRGGVLASPPDAVQALFDAFPIKRSPAEWCFRDVYNMEGITVVLSGINTMAQLEENLRIFESAEINCLSPEEQQLLINVKKCYDEQMVVPCTGCAYCMPCPQGVSIPSVFKAWNGGAMGDWRSAKQRYARMAKSNSDASQCVECGLCMPECPQEINIIEKLKEANAALL